MRNISGCERGNCIYCNFDVIACLYYKGMNCELIKMKNINLKCQNANTVWQEIEFGKVNISHEVHLRYILSQKEIEIMYFC